MTAQAALSMVSNTDNTPDNDVAELLRAVREIDRISNEAWQNTLNDRKRKELEFHDAHRIRQEEQKSQEDVEQSQSTDSYEKFYGNKKYYKATDRSRQFVQNWIKTNVPGKVVLDYACGNGELGIEAAKAGAKFVLGLDISPISVENARADAAANGVADKTFHFQADAENTKLPDNSVDIVFCSGMLHHLDLSYAFPELRRILKPGGRIIAVEALDYNPMIKLYRMMTPAMRTDWEKAHILSHKDLRFAKHFFTVQNINYWHILGIITPHLPRSLAKPIAMLDALLEKIPGVQMMAWIFTFELKKPL